MRSVRQKNVLPNFPSVKAAVLRLHWCSLVLFLLLVCRVGSALAQSQSQSSGTSAAEPSPQAQTDSSTKSQPPSQPSPKAESVAGAARKAKTQRGASGKVFTEDDLSSLPGNSVSVVGQGSAASSRKTRKYEADEGANSGNDEAYWRGRAGDLLQQISMVDRQIAQLQEEIKKYGNGGFDPATGLSKNVIYIEDRSARLKKLETRKEDLQQQMEALEEQGRKAGAPPGWFR